MEIPCCSSFVAAVKPSNLTQFDHLAKFCRLFSRMEEGELGLVLLNAQKMARRKALQGVEGSNQRPSNYENLLK
jgi:hypothetical protein